jgi:hypothetical protein
LDQCSDPLRAAGLWSRVGGDVLDIATLFSAYTDDNPKKTNVGLALSIVVGITGPDLATAGRTTAVHSRPRRGPPRDYGDRSGWPMGPEVARRHLLSTTGAAKAGWQRVAMQAFNPRNRGPLRFRAG